MTEEQADRTTPAEGVASTGHGDVVDLLLRQHGALRRLCEEVANAAPGAKEEPFRALVRLMAVHEAVEEEIVHPYVKRRVGAEAGVPDLLDEEREVKKMLVALDALGPSGAGFDALFAQFRTLLLAHASKEEKGEFSGLREKTGQAERTAIAAAVRVASAMAPTHPHPGLESGPRSVLVGTPMAMIDRARDMLRDAMGGRSRTSGPHTSGPHTSGPHTSGPPTSGPHTSGH
jgi:hemerythrin superfamily protein